MADRYWVGGTASWDATAGTKWATTDGGAGGASAPTAADDVYLTAASGAVSITIGSGATGKSLICTGFTGTITGSAQWNLWGGMTLVPSMTFLYNGTLTFSTSDATAYNITTAGKTLAAIFFGNSAPSTGSWALQDALVASGSITVNRGTFTTNNYAVTATSLSSNNSNTRTINLGSSTVTLSGSGASVWTTATTTGLTFNAGTSTVTLSNAASSITIAGGGVTFYNVSISGAGSNTLAVTGANTFNNFAVTGPASAGVRQITFDSRQTINGTLSTTGTAGNRRVWFSGLTYGLAQTLTINSTPSLTDADFRDIYVIGTAAPISGTRIGDLRGCRGITFDAPKTVYWSSAAGGTWSATNWAATSGGATSNDNFPLAQDTAVIENTGLNTSATVTLNATLPFIGTIDMSTRTNAATIAISSGNVVYGDWVTGSGITYSGGVNLTFSGRNTQTITSAGKQINNVAPIIDSYGGVVQLADAFSSGSGITVTNGTFTTQGYAVTVPSLSSSNSNVRAVNLGSSTVTLSSQLTFTTSTNFSFNAGTSSIVLSASSPTFDGGGLTFYNVSFTSTSTAAGATITGQNTFQNLTCSAPSSAGLRRDTYAANQTITGTLTVSGATAVSRIFVRSDTIGTQRDLTVGTLVADDCDFRDIEILGAAIGTAPTRAGDCGGNNNITFPSPKTVYWNLAGTQNWSDTGWASSSGGTPNINQFPLAQDTAVFDDAGSAGTITNGISWNIGALNASSRTTGMVLTISSSASPVFYKDLTFGAGITIGTGTFGTYVFSGRGTQTITSNGVAFNTNNNITIDSFSGTVQLADALTLNSNRTLTLTSGTFDAVTYNVTTGLVSLGSTIVQTLKMGSGTWTLSGTGNVWLVNNITNFTFLKGTANIVLSDTSATARTFVGGAFSYNKLTIGGATGASTTTINSNNQFTELASTKTVAHTIALGTTTQTFGAWTVTGTAGNVVTVTGTGTSHVIAGARVSGVDYLAMGTIGFFATSSGEFYAGANSTGSNATIIKTAAPTPVTRYWRGGTGTWDATTTTNWSDTSGGAGGFSVPTSADAVVFDLLSNATAYTVTCTATRLRCGSLTMAGPLTGNVTWAGTAPLTIHDDVTLASTGLVVSYSGSITLSGSSTGRTFTTNGVALVSTITVNGVGCGWTLGSALSSAGTTLTITNGSFDSASYNIAVSNIFSNNANTRSITFGSGTITLSGSTSINFGNSAATSANLDFDAGTSTISCTGNAPYIISFLPAVFYNVSFDSTSLSSAGIFNTGTFNNITVAGRTSAGIGAVVIDTFDVTVLGTLALSAGADATCRTFVRSVSLGTTRTLTCAAVASLTDVDFRDITIAGAAAPVSGTRLGDCKGNSGITFDAAKTVYWRGGTGNWSSASGWSDTDSTPGGTTFFPLAQDTATFITSPASGATVTINAAYNIGTIDMSARTSNTMTLATGVNTPQIYGNWINGTGTTLTGTGVITFAGRGSQTITSAGIAFTQNLVFNNPSGAVTLQDAFTSTNTTASCFAHTGGTFDANGYNVTLAGQCGTNLTNTRTLAFGSGTWTLSFTGIAFTATATNLTVTGTGTISLTSASAKTFAGGSISYSGITLNQGGAGTLTITGNNTFANISNSYSATGATTIAMGTTTQRVANFTASGEAGRVLTVQGTSASSPATLVFTGSGQATAPTTDYLTITGVRAYNLTTTWYAGANSTNNGSLGWYFEAGGGGSIAVYITEAATASDAASTTATLNISVSETTTASDTVSAGAVLLGTLSESATAADMVEAIKLFLASVSESATSSDLIAAALTFASTVSELTTASDSAASSAIMSASASELAAAADSIAGGLFFLSDITEAATVADTAAALVIFNRAISEAATASEVLAAIATFQAAVPESVVGSDVARALIRVGASVSEALSALDEVVLARTTSPAVAEAATTSESATNVYTARPTISETIQVIDAAQVVASTFSAASAETANALDTPQGANTGTSTLAESATVSASNSAAFNPSTQISESAQQSDSTSAVAAFFSDASELATAQDQASVAPSVFSAVALAAAEAAESFNPAGSIYNVVLPIQGAGITDSLVGAFLWNDIDDTQIPDWGDVNNTQTPAWAAVDDTQSVSWQNVNTTQTPAWTDVNDTQTPGWTPITPQG